MVHLTIFNIKRPELLLNKNVSWTLDCLSLQGQMLIFSMLSSISDTKEFLALQEAFEGAGHPEAQECFTFLLVQKQSGKSEINMPSISWGPREAVTEYLFTLPNLCVPAAMGSYYAHLKTIKSRLIVNHLRSHGTTKYLLWYRKSEESQRNSKDINYLCCIHVCCFVP